MTDVKELDTLKRLLETCFYYNYDIGNTTNETFDWK